MSQGQGIDASGASDTLDALTKSLRATTGASRSNPSGSTDHTGNRPLGAAPATGPVASVKAVVAAYAEHSSAKAA